MFKYYNMHVNVCIINQVYNKEIIKLIDFKDQVKKKSFGQ